MDAPSLDDLQEVFGHPPESVAEVSTALTLPLDQWPDGEVLLSTAVAGRSASVYLCPRDGTVTIQIDSPDPIVRLTFEHVDGAEAVVGPGQARAISFALGTGRSEHTIALRTRPEIDLRSG